MAEKQDANITDFMNESIATITPLALTLPTAAANPVDVYINSLSSRLSQSTMRNALRSVVRVMADEKWATIEADNLTDDDVRAVSWQNLTRSHLDALRAALIRRYEPAGALLRMNAIRGVMKKAWSGDLMTTDSYMRAVQVEAITVHQSDRGRALSKEEISKLLAACAESDHFAASRDAAVLAVMIFGGLRREEACNLDLADYDPEQASLKVKGKGNKKRTTYLCEDGMDVLNTWLERRAQKAKPSQKHLFLTFHCDGRLVRPDRMTTATVNVIVRRICLRAGIPVISPHDCRRTFATLLFAAGADIFTVQSLMGHAKPETTKRYDKRPEASKRAVVELLSLKTETKLEA